MIELSQLIKKTLVNRSLLQLNIVRKCIKIYKICIFLKINILYRNKTHLK